MQAADRKRYVLSSVYSCVFNPSVSVSSSAAESMSTVVHLGQMENDVNLSFLQIHSVFVLTTALSLSDSEFPCTLIAEWILEKKYRNGCFPMSCRFSSIQIYIVNSLHYRGQNIADFRPKLTGVFSSANVFFFHN